MVCLTRPLSLDPPPTAAAAAVDVRVPTGLAGDGSGAMYDLGPSMPVGFAVEDRVWR